MGDFQKYLRHLSDELAILSSDVAKMSKQPEVEAKGKTVSFNSLQPTVKMYKDEKEIKFAKENPQVDFIRQQINKIFGK